MLSNIMNPCEYKPVIKGDETDTFASQESNDDHEESWTPFLRQFLVSSSVWILYFQVGLCLGATTVIVPQMREEKGENYVSQEIASWMSSAMIYAALPWPPIIAFLANVIGRRYTFTVGAVTTIMGFAVLCAGDSPQYVLAGMIAQGPLAALQMTITLLVLTEYTSPKYRGLFLTVKSATVYWGIWIANIIGTVANWHYIAWLGLASGIYNILVLFFWPESPYWLASKGRLQQCMKAHRWLKGTGLSSEKELEELIRRQQQPMSIEEKDPSDREEIIQTGRWRQIYFDMKSKGFYKPLFLNMILAAQYHLSGKIVYSVYAIDIIKDITKSKSNAYIGMLILDAVTLIGMYAGCGLSRRLTRRLLLFSAGTVSIMFLLISSLYLFLVKFELILENKFVTIALLTCFSISISCGPIVLNSALGAELLPLRLRTVTLTVVAIYLYLLMGTTIKVAPSIFENLGMSGTFLLYGLTSGICLLFLYIYLPETKDKTLNEIEKLIIGITSEDKCKSEDSENIKHDDP